jgi:aminobenzoyl-glutamate utilization protein B
MAMATPIAHKGAVAGAKVIATTMIDLLQDETLVEEAHNYFENVQTAEEQYVSFVGPDDAPAIEKNAEIMEQYRPLLEEFYFDSTQYDTYLEQLGIEYPQLEPNTIQPGQ